MSVVSFDEWKKRKAVNSRGLREDIALKEQYGYDLCVYISEERSQPTPDASHLEQLWVDLRTLIASLPHEHAYHYFKAFEAFCEGNEDDCISRFDQFLESEKRLFGDIAGSDWWIDSFIWVFTPPFAGMYGRCGELFFKHWPLCAMGWICEALELAEADEENLEAELDLLMMSIQADPKCFLAYFLIATIFFDMRQWKSALPYFEKASESTMYSADPNFYFDYAWTADKAQKYDLALGLYNTCLALDERFPCGVNNLGCVYLRMGKYEDALREFNRAISLSVDGALPYRNAVAALEKLGRFGEAARFIEQHMTTRKLGKRYSIELDRLNALSETAKSGKPAVPVAPTLSLETEAPRKEGDQDDDLRHSKRMLEDEIERRIERGETVFGRQLKVFEGANGYGRQYHIPGAGRVDLLCVDEENHCLCVIALYSGDADELALLRMWQQIQVVRKNVATRWQKVVGLLCCADASEQMLSLHKTLAFEDVRIFRYEFSLKEIQ